MYPKNFYDVNEFMIQTERKNVKMNHNIKNKMIGKFAEYKMIKILFPKM